MNMHFKILLALLISSAVLTQDNCKDTWPADDLENTGCKTCVDGAYYLKDVTPAPTSSSSASTPALSLYSLEQGKKTWTCIKCPDNALKCDWKETKVVIEACEDKFYKKAVADAAVSDSCSKCPDNALKCEWKDTKVIILKCEDKLYKKAVADAAVSDSCSKCPDKALKCDWKETKVVIEICEDKFYSKAVADAAISDFCENCPDKALKCK